MKQLIHMSGCHGKSNLTEPGLFSETWNCIFFQLKKNRLAGMIVLLLSCLNAKPGLMQVAEPRCAN